MKTKDIFIFLGPPGSGKGSLSQLLVKRLNWKQLSTGNLCREHIASKSDIGQQIDFAIKSGKLISDSLIIAMVNDWLDKTFVTSPAVIFDGFPRTVPQAESLHGLIKTLNEVKLNLFRLVLPDEEVVYRLLARYICQNNTCQRVYSMHKHSALQPKRPMMCNECDSSLTRRTDDEAEAIYERLRVYHAHEKELLDFYSEIGHPIHTLQANVPLENVYAHLIETGHVSV